MSVAEPRLKAFCLRLGDSGLPEQEWVESIGSFICSKPPAKWADVDFAFLCEEKQQLLEIVSGVELAENLLRLTRRELFLLGHLVQAVPAKVNRGAWLN